MFVLITAVLYYLKTVCLFGCARSQLWHAGLAVACGIQFPDQGLNPGPLRRECGA